MATTSALVKGGEQLHLVLASLTLSFWRMRLLVEKRVRTTPLKLPILQMISKEEVVSPGEICRRFGLGFSRISRLIQSLERGAATSKALHRRPPVFAPIPDQEGTGVPARADGAGQRLVEEDREALALMASLLEDRGVFQD